ncbi:MAG: hypothetical protein R3F05_15375 [Planctomycetota bacterium]
MKRRTLSRALLVPGVLVAAAACGEQHVNPFEKKILQVPRRVGSEELDAHLLRLHGKTPGERAAALWALSDLGTADDQIRSVLPDALRDPSDEVRFAALHALARRGLAPGASGGEVGGLVVDLLDADAVGLRAAARDAIPALGPTVVEALASRLRAESRRTRWNAAAALERLGPDADQALTQLTRSLTSEQDEAVRERIAGALSHLGTGGPFVLLTELANSRAGQGGSALEALRRVPADRLAPAARQALGEIDKPEVRDAVAQLAAENRELALLLVPELVRLLDDEGPAALDAEDALASAGEAARSALHAKAAAGPSPGADAARGLLERLDGR